MTKELPIDDVVTLYVLKGKSLKETAEHFGVSSGAIRTLLKRQNITLRKQGSHGHCKHELSKHRLYNVWNAMLQRCTNPKNSGYHNYGGRGITVCERWYDIRLFIEDMESTWKEGLTIERLNNDKGYSPENCKWVTYSEQSINKRKWGVNHYVS